MSNPRVSLRRVYLDKGGYANKGRTYFGIGTRLYEYEFETDISYEQGFVHGVDRDTAKLQVRKQYPELELVFRR